MSSSIRQRALEEIDDHLSMGQGGSIALGDDGWIGCDVCGREDLVYSPWSIDIDVPTIESFVEAHRECGRVDSRVQDEAEQLAMEWGDGDE